MDATSQNPEVLGGELVFVTCDLWRVTSEAALRAAVKGGKVGRWEGSVEAVVRFFGLSVEQDKRRGDPPSLGYGVTGRER
jgi:hypothetical protein